MRKLLIAATGLLALAGAAPAQDIGTAHLDALDSNDDGSVDTTEFEAYMVAAFKTIDKDGDGYVTLVEAQGYMTPEQFAAANTDADDGLSEAEFLAAAKADFLRADLDQDGALD
jgi:Ca2+-binding EF-hand superfamily protein